MNLYSQDYIGLDTLKHQAMLLALMGSVMTLMCAQAIFLLPQTLARVLGFSDGDYSGNAGNIYELNGNPKTSISAGGSSSRSTSTTSGQVLPEEKILQQAPSTSPGKITKSKFEA